MKTRSWIAILLSGLLVACAIDPKRSDILPAAQIIVPPAPPSAAAQLLNHVVNVRKLEAREFAIARESARSQFQFDKSDLNRIKYALMLVLVPLATTSVQTSAIQDDAELIALIDPLISGTGAANTSTDSEIRALATLLHSMVSDRRKVREQLRDTQTRLAVAKKEDARDAEARVLRARVDELEAKLNALKSIDRSVNRRAESVRK